MKKLGAAIFLGVVAALVFYVADVSTLAGADPAWSGSLLASGAVLGTVLALATLHIEFVPRTIGLSLLCIGAYLTADYGRQVFTASLAKDEIAQQMWFYGWHVFCIAMIAHVISSTYQQLTWNAQLK